MIKQYDFQDRAIDWLLDVSSDPTSKQTFVLKAPTGSGKTVMLIQYIDKYLSHYDKKTAFVWLCPGKGDLEEQSRKNMEAFLPNRPTNDLFDALLNGFEAGTTTFINWERVTKKDNKAITDGEKKNLFERISQAHKDGISFILIIDEEHSNNTAKARDIIDYFIADHIIRVSATTVANRDVEFYEIDEQDVIDEGLITSAISVNEGFESGMAEDDNLLLELANTKRKEIYQMYQELGKDIRPLVLIQFPNGEPDKIKSVEEKLKQMGYTRENKMVAAWLSGDKKDIPHDLTNNNSELAFLFIKQAINTGWDCPRAKILVKLREGSDEAFQVQTIGRIRRMPEQKHYDITVLDLCYVYTFDKDFRVGLLAGLDKAYIPKRVFLKEKCRNLKLTKELRAMDGGAVDMRTVYNQIRDYYVQKYTLDSNKELNKSKLSRDYKFDKNLLGSIINGVFTLTDSVGGTGTVDTSTPVNTHEHGMLMRHTIDRFKNIIGIQAETIRQILERLFCFKHNNKDKLLSLGMKEYYAFIINNQHIIREALRDISSEVNTQNRLIEPKTSTFTIPLEELYHFDPLEKNHKLLESNAYKDYTMEYVTENCDKSTAEILFERYCENNDKIDWVYKNGDSGQQYLSIVYYNNMSRKQKLFYPDYIVKLKGDDTVWIIEAKGGQRGTVDKNIDKQIQNKFESFKRYAEHYNLNWGFVRDMNNDLYFNNTEYVSDLHDNRWILLEKVF